MALPDLLSRLARVECPAFPERRAARERESGATHAPIFYARAEGSTVVDVDGKAYVDMAAGFGALPFGHAHPLLVHAAEEQLTKLTLSLGDLYGSLEKVELMEALAFLFPEPGARVLLGLAGADAVTAALKTCVLATGKPDVVAFRGAYHGLSHGPLAACGYATSFRAPFESQTGHFVHFAPYPATAAELDAALAAVEAFLSRGTVGAVLVEPILGRGGVVTPPDSFLPSLRCLCDTHRALLVIDEIWTGLGRTGVMLASSPTIPDVLCLGKALGGGLPISACIGRERVMKAWGGHGGSRIHTATHFGAPLACRAALACLSLLRDPELLLTVREKGDRFQEALRRAVGEEATVSGRGLMVGVRMRGGAPRALSVARALLQRGAIVVTGGASGDVLTLTPPLIIADAELTKFAEDLGEVLHGRG